MRGNYLWITTRNILNKEEDTIMKTKMDFKTSELNYYPVYRFVVVLSFSCLLLFLGFMSVSLVDIDFFDEADISYANVRITESSIPSYSHNILTDPLPSDMNRIATTAWLRQEANVEELVDILNQQERRPQQTAFYNSTPHSVVIPRSTDQADS